MLNISPIVTGEVLAPLHSRTATSVVMKPWLCGSALKKSWETSVSSAGVGENEEDMTVLKSGLSSPSSSSSSPVSGSAM